MPRTENRKVTYTLEIDTAQIHALGGTTYFLTDRADQVLGMMGDAAVKVLGYMEELWPKNRDYARRDMKKFFMNFIETGGEPGTYPVYSVSQKTGDFSSWDVKVEFKYIP